MDRTTGPRDPVETKGAASKHGEVPPHKPAFTSDNLAALFECPVCRDYALPPIQQCENGHLVCSSCKTKTPRCPICRRPRGGNLGTPVQSAAFS
ncbi:hypothetical protein HPB49_004482 [Dermacentor silvarum]|uniref:Uncharacterized protein n=1 Tax=Dermacentor silvarum TaxID=543639 RepID=A0ACB8CPV5_DERSI|nr:hypothetical protein HPB49_004482 [Dermacentor silvarum]